MANFMKKIRSMVEDIRWKDATSPSWWVNFVRGQIRLYFYIARETIQDRCLRQAASLTFTTLLAMVPLFVVAFSFFRGFEAFQGIEKRAESAIFNTLLAAPLRGGGAQRTDWEKPPEELSEISSSDLPPEKLLSKADDLSRRAQAYRAARLYIEALNRGAVSSKARQGLASLYFGHREIMERCLKRLSKEGIDRYRSAANLPPPTQSPEIWKGYKHYVQALSQQDQLNYKQALETLKKAESHQYSLSKTRLARAHIHNALGDARKKENDYQAAAEQYQHAMRATTDGIVLAGKHTNDDVLQRLIKLHNNAVRRLGEVLLVQGKQQMAGSQQENAQTQQGDGQTPPPSEAVESLRKAVRYLEFDPEAQAALADALWEQGDRTGAREHYQKASRSSRTGAARGFSVAVTDKIQQMVSRGSTAGLGIVGILFLVITATSLFSTIESTLNGIWQVDERRPFWIKFTAFCTLIWLGPALIAAGIIIREKLGHQAAATFLGVPGLDTLFRLTTTLGRYVLPFITVWFVLLAIYKFLPHTYVRFGSASWGAFVGALLIQIARPSFGFYVSHAVRYQKIYGSLSAIPFFLLWLWLLWILVLFGAEVAFTVQNIGLLAFRERIHHVSRRYIDRFLAARVLMYVGREFWSNASPMPAEKLAEELQIPYEEARDAADKLVELGFLTHVGEEQTTYHPSSDLSQLKIIDILSISDRIRLESRSTRDKDSLWEQKLENIFDRAANAQAEEIGDKSFHDLIVACENESPSNNK